MAHFLRPTVFFILFLLLSSCNNLDKEQSKKNAGQSEFLRLEKFRMDTSSISILWTAYKFTNKVGVSGTFDAYKFETNNTSGTVENMLKKSKLSIPTATVNSSNAIRDFKLDSYFFKAFNTSEIKGTITKIEDDEGIIDLKMNRTSKKIPFTYTIENDTIKLFTNINLSFWKAEEALKILNTECFELHKGVDGISKLWPDVDVLIKIPVNRVSITK